MGIRECYCYVMVASLNATSQPQVSRGFLYLLTVKEIWDVVAQTYSQVCNIAKVYQLRQEISHLRQEDKSLLEYRASFKWYAGGT